MVASFSWLDRKKVSSHTFLIFGFFAFSFLSLVQSWNDLSRLFVFLVMFPAVFYAIYKGAYRPVGSVAWTLLYLLFAYLFLSATVFSESGEVPRYVRWLVGTLCFIWAVFLMVKHWLKNPGTYGAVLLTIVAVASLWALLGYHVLGIAEFNRLFEDAVTNKYGTRLAWTGFLEHPIKGPSVVVVLYAIGTVLFALSRHRSLGRLIVWFVATALVVGLCMSSGSRGPTASMAVFLLAFFSGFVMVAARKHDNVLWVLGIALVLVGGAAGIFYLVDGHLVAQKLISRGDGRRFELWSVVWNSLPDSLWFGCGVATEFVNCSTGKALEAHFGSDMSHSHNVFIHGFVTTGAVGLLFFIALLGSILINILQARVNWEVRFLSLLILLLFVLITGTEGYRLISSPKMDWFVVWLPVIFAWSLVVHYAEATSENNDS